MVVDAVGDRGVNAGEAGESPRTLLGACETLEGASYKESGR